jgi:hypothetical protein
VLQRKVETLLFCVVVGSTAPGESTEIRESEKS